MLVVRARDNPIVDDKGGIHIGATSIFDVVLNTVISSDVSAFNKLGGNQQLASMTKIEPITLPEA